MVFAEDTSFSHERKDGLDHPPPKEPQDELTYPKLIFFSFPKWITKSIQRQPSALLDQLDLARAPKTNLTTNFLSVLCTGKLGHGEACFVPRPHWGTTVLAWVYLVSLTSQMLTIPSLGK